MEIVSEPDMRSPEEAGAYLRKLRTILRYLGTCDGNMEEGSMRADVNVSVRKHGEPFRTRCEVKNVNSIRFVMQAIEAEARRQVAVWEDGGTVEQETRLYDSGRGETRSMRSKEDAHDYRYFPDPDLLPLVLDEDWIASLKSALPELPDAKRARFMAQYGLPFYDANVLVAEQATADFYEAVARGRDGKQAANWVLGDFFAALNRTGRGIEDSPVSAASLGSLLDRIADKTINGRIAKEVFEAMVETGDDAGRDHRAQGLAAGDGHRRDRRGGGCGARRQRRQGRGLSRGQDAAVRLLRRPGDEGDGGQGQSRAGQRGAEETAVIGNVGCRSSCTPGTPRTGARSAWRSRRWACRTRCIRWISPRASSTSRPSSRSARTTASRRSSIRTGRAARRSACSSWARSCSISAARPGKFLPEDLRAQVPVLEWLMWQMGGFGPMPGQVHHFLTVENEADRRYGLERYLKETNRLYGVLDRRLAKVPFVAGEDVSVADFAIVAWAWRHERHQVDLANYPNVRRWYDTMMARPGVQRGFEVALN